MVAASEARREMGPVLAKVAGWEPVVSALWVSADHEGLHFWVLTDPIDAETERRLYELADALDEHFPGVVFQLHVLNPRHFRGTVRDVVPAGAKEIPLRAA